MITLRDLFQVTWDITELDITAREPDTTQYVHRWIYGEDIAKPVHIRYEQGRGAGGAPGGAESKSGQSK